MLKCGMEFEGVLRQAGKNNRGIIDICQHSITAEEYFARRGSDQAWADDVLSRAAAYAAHCHAGQMRKESGVPCIIYPMEAASMQATCEKINLIVGGESVSSCTLVIADNDDPNHGFRPFAIIENVLTLPEHRRKGYAKKMLSMAIEKARSAGCYKVMLATGSSREYVHNLYEGLGFDGSAKTCYTMSFE